MPTSTRELGEATLEHWHRGKLGSGGRRSYEVLKVTKTQVHVSMGGSRVRLRIKDGFPVGIYPSQHGTIECMKLADDELPRFRALAEGGFTR